LVPKVAIDIVSRPRGDSVAKGVVAGPRHLATGGSGPAKSISKEGPMRMPILIMLVPFAARASRMEHWPEGLARVTLAAAGGWGRIAPSACLDHAGGEQAG
jgi:hypothetical protein